MNDAVDPRNRLDAWRDVLARRKNVLAVVLLLLATLPLLTKVFTSDFGTHIALGRQIVQSGSIPDKEFLNYPSLGRPNPNGEWGFQALLYLVHAAAGIYGVSFLCWAVVFGIYLLIHRSTVLRGADPFVTVLAIFAFSGFLRIRIQPRPEIFTYLFTALTIFILSEYYLGKAKRIIYLFPPMILVWANMHPTYLMAFALCGAFFVDALARAAWNREFRWEKIRAWVVPPVVVGVAGLVLCGLNPHGYDAILMPLHLISRGSGGGASPVLMSISELTPVKGTGMYSYYVAAAVFGGISLVLGAVGRRVYLLDLFLFAIAFKGAWDSARAVSMMGLFLSPGISLHVTGFLARTAGWFAPKAARKTGEPGRDRQGKKDRSRKEREKEKAGRPPKAAPETARFSWFRAAVVAVVVAALGIFGGTTLAFSISQLEYGVGMTEHKFSFAAAEFLRKNPIPGNMFNFFDIGGFLDWQLYPQQMTFIDGRTYNQEVFVDHQMVTSGMRGWEEILKKYGATHVVTKAIDSSGMILPLVPILANDPAWSLVFSDGLFLVFVRNSPDNQAYIRMHEIPKARIPQHIITESYHYIFLGVSPAIAYQTMSNMYMVTGNRQAAVEALRKGLEFGEDPMLRARLMQLEGGGRAW